MDIIPEIAAIAKKTFHISSFRDLQEEVITTIVNKKDIIAILPTGSGKSITYQIPALYFEGLSLIISPLISLMKDQVENLKNKIHFNDCDYIASDKTQEEINTVTEKLSTLKLLYISPERLQTPKFLNILKEKNIKISMIAIDEAHCVSLWGNNFRPSYLKIGEFCRHFPESVLAAFTATATPEIIQDIRKHLSLRKPLIVQKSVRRENLRLRVHFINNKIKYLIDHVDNDLPAIIYTNSRFMTENIAYLLSINGKCALPYHAGLSTAVRNENQDLFLSGKSNIIVATSAFGMGIDKKDVRMIYHFEAPLDLESYVQETGRAGRDGLPASCVLLFSMEDMKNLESSFIRNYPEWKTLRKVLRKNSSLTAYEVHFLEQFKQHLGIEQIETIKNIKRVYLAKRLKAYQKFIKMKDYILLNDCRMKFLEKYFGFDGTDCNHCDYCQTLKTNFNLNSFSENEKRLTVLLQKGPAKITDIRQTAVGFNLSSAIGPGYKSLEKVDQSLFYQMINNLKNNYILTLMRDHNYVFVSKSFHQYLKNNSTLFYPEKS